MEQSQIVDRLFASDSDSSMAAERVAIDSQELAEPVVPSSAFEVPPVEQATTLTVGLVPEMPPLAPTIIPGLDGSGLTGIPNLVPRATPGLDGTGVAGSPQFPPPPAPPAPIALDALTLARVIREMLVEFVPSIAQHLRSPIPSYTENDIPAALTQELLKIEEKVFNCLLYTSPSPRD